MRQDSRTTVDLNVTYDPDPNRVRRLANLLFSSTVVIAGSTAITTGMSS